MMKIEKYLGELIVVEWSLKIKVVVWSRRERIVFLIYSVELV